MAHYDAHKGRGYDLKEPIYGGRPASVMSYSTEERSSYTASSEQYVMYDGYTTRPDLHRNSVYPQLIKKGDEYDHSPRFGHVSGSPRDSPRKAFQSPNSPPPGGHFSSVYSPHLDSPTRKNYRDDHPNPYGAGAHHVGHPRNNFRDGHVGRFSSDDDSSDDEVECRDGVCYPKPKHGARQDYGKEKNKANGYAPGVEQLYSEQPRKDPYNKQSNGAHAYSAPAHTKPTTDAYYDRYSYPDDHSRGGYTVPAPVKTRADLGEGGRGSPVAAMAQWTPFAASSPRKGNAQPQSAPAMGRRGAIDCETAARKYGGVFVK
ncbi:hypothetical protein SASPL_112077 [Salvia splendens]|uniref:Uncharacterized protein n=1 Tax=Salvia splendens TaxID=180675 RepID=A0A8X8Y7J0_SALSN|nr:hypothetical protein SASPL_112077 [Salvia splendens]